MLRSITGHPGLFAALAGIVSAWLLLGPMEGALVVGPAAPE